MSSALRPLRAACFALLLSALGCHAQLPAANGTPLPPELAWRVEVLLRSNAQLPPETQIVVGQREPSTLNGYDQIPVTFKIQGQTSPPTIFLISKDNKSLGQLRTFDITADPRAKVNGAGRPGRGGPDDAPVQIVGFDDLECPFCARLHTQLFPLLLQRYGNQIHVAYRDFPLEQHPWAIRAAVDVNCLGAQSVPGYWNTVDYIHAHAADIWDTDPKTLPKTNDRLDQLVRDEGKRDHINMSNLEACIAKQDAGGVEASRKLGEALNVDATPSLYINGDRIDGAVSPEFLFKIIDQALIAAGKTPPPPYVSPAAPAAPGNAPASSTAAPAKAPAK